MLKTRHLFLCITTCAVLLIAPSPSLSFNCETLEGAWQQRMETLESESYWPCNRSLYVTDFEPTCAMEENNALYHSYINHLFFSSTAGEQCDVDDEVVIIFNNLKNALDGTISVEEFSANLLEHDGIVRAIWEVNPIVGRIDEYRDHWVESIGDMPTYLIGYMLTESLSPENQHTFQLWSDMLVDSEGDNATMFSSDWILLLFRNRSEQVLQMFDQLETLEGYFENSFCWGILPEERAVLVEVYSKYPDNETAKHILTLMDCGEQTP